MQNNSENANNEPVRGRKKSAVRLSKDGKWRSFPRVPHLSQYVISGTYFARIKINGKNYRESLETTVWTDAQLKLVDFLKNKQTVREEKKAAVVSFSEATRLYKKRVQDDHAMKPRSKGYRMLCIKKIESSWPDLTKRLLGEITEQDCRQWAIELKPTIASQYFNNVVGTLRLIIAEGIREQKRLGGKLIENPASELTRAKITQKVLKLPERDQFKAMVSHIRNGSSWGSKASNLVEFLAYSGLRLYTEAQWVMWEDIDWVRKEILVRGQPDTATKNWEVRRLPILPDMENLLERMKSEKPEPRRGKLLELIECPISLEKACVKIGIPKITHHDLRHLFATRCIESDVPISTVAKWLGHKDGGALAGRVYGHLRDEHSQAMAARVKF